MEQTGISSRLMVLMFTDLVGSVDLKTRLGNVVYAPMISRHDALFRKVIASLPGSEILKDTGDGFLARFTTASDAIVAALRFQHAIKCEPWKPEAVQTRVGIHIGEVAELEKEEATGLPKLVGLAADVSARVMGLAMPGQILMTRTAFDDARQYIRQHPTVNGSVEENVPELKWMAHGPYLFKGNDEPIDVYEVGAIGVAPLHEPPDSEKARRAVKPGEEELLGWRPASGLPIPGRKGWNLDVKLGEGGFGEVWLGIHQRTKTKRVFKFCFDADRLRSFKRELTLFRLLRDALGERKDIATLYEVQLDKAPYYLESEYTDKGDLKNWVAKQGGLEAIPLQKRLDIVARTAEAVAAAHSVGILHKDIKPANILMYAGDDGDIRPRLADFGIGMMTDDKLLAQQQITITGFTEIDLMHNESSRTGTRMYAPPETLAGKPFTIQGDIYALGVFLNQMTIGDLYRPLAPGWEREVSDDLLREDIAICVDGDAERRLPAAIELTRRLQALEARREKRRLEELERQRAARRKRILRATIAASVMLAGMLAVAVVGFVRERDARLAEAAAKGTLTDMLESFDPDIAGSHKIAVENMLAVGSQTAAKRLQDEPETQSDVLTTLGKMLLVVGDYSEAETQLARALALREGLFHDAHEKVAESRYELARAEYWLEKYDHAVTLYDQSLKVRQELFGQENLRVADSLNGLAACKRKQKRFTEAETLYVQAKGIRERLLGANSVEAAMSLNNLASLYRDQKKYEEAQTMFQDALKKLQQASGPNHLVFEARGLHNLAACLLDQSKLPEAEPVLTAALEKTRGVLGEDHPYTAQCLFQWARYKLLTGAKAEAEQFCTQALAIQTQRLGSDSQMTKASQALLQQINSSS